MESDWYPARWLNAILDRVSWWVGLAVSRRGLSLAYFTCMAIFTLTGWVRPPIGRDIGGLHIPLLADDSGSATAAIYGPRSIAPLGVGTLMLGTIAIGVILVSISPKRVDVAAGLILCATLISTAAVWFNHADWVGELDRQDLQRRAIVTLLEESAVPPIPITSYPRVDGLPVDDAHGLWLNMGTYVPRHRSLFYLATFVAVALAVAGPLQRRLGYVLVWTSLGLVLGGVVSHKRLLAERLWVRAVDSDASGRLDEAEDLAWAALTGFPQMTSGRQAWEFLGRLDYRRGRDTSEARYFLAIQQGRNGDERGALGELNLLLGDKRLGKEIAKSFADILVLRAVRQARGYERDVAMQSIERAIELDPSQEYLPLFTAALRAPIEREDPTAVATLVDGRTPAMADRALAAALEAMLGDCYFECGYFSDARLRYDKSMALYSLPKQINYRGMRGKLGM